MLKSQVIEMSISIVHETPFQGGAAKKIASALEILEEIARLCRENEKLRSEDMDKWEVSEVNGDVQLKKGDQTYLISDSEIKLNDRRLEKSEYKGCIDAAFECLDEHGCQGLIKHLKDALLASVKQ